MIERLHTLQNPIYSFNLSNAGSINLTGPITFNVNAILPIPNSLVNSWSLNGSSQVETTSALTLSPANFNMGTNTVLFSVTDNNSLLKVDNHATLHVATVSWTINKTLAAIEVNSAQRNFQVYPNPAKSQIFIKDESKTLKNISVEIYDVAGRNLKNPKVQNLSANEISVNVDGLLPQSYIIKVYENKNLILTQKIIKE